MVRGQEVRLHPEGGREAGRDGGGEEALLQDQGHVQALDRLVEGPLDRVDGEGCNEGRGREGREGGDLEALDGLACGGGDLAVRLLCATGARDEGAGIPEQRATQHDVRAEDLGDQPEPPCGRRLAEQDQGGQGGQGSEGHRAGSLPDGPDRIGLRDRGPLRTREPCVQADVQGAGRGPRCSAEGGRGARGGGGGRGGGRQGGGRRGGG